MLSIPARLSLTAQAANAIRSGIIDGTWMDFIPSERHLCELLQISRPTVRTALKVIEEEGLILIQQGRRNRIISRPARPEKSTQNPLITVITHESSYSMSAISHHGISEIRSSLAQHGFTTDTLVCSSFSTASQIQRIESYIEHNSVLCCVLVSVTKEIQEWFSNHSIPALVLGSCHEAIKLPSIDIAYHAVCRHAGSVFLNKGHRSLALIRPDTGLAGDDASEAGFLASLDARPDVDAPHAHVIGHDCTGRDLRLKLDRLFNSDIPPTALLVLRLSDVMAIMLYLLKRGLSVPDSVSLIARDHNDLFDSMDPPITHYRFKVDTYSHRLSRLVLQLVNEGRVSDKPNLIFPDFVAGGTVKNRSK